MAFPSIETADCNNVTNTRTSHFYLSLFIYISLANLHYV